MSSCEYADKPLKSNALFMSILISLGFSATAPALINGLYILRGVKNSLSPIVSYCPAHVFFEVYLLSTSYTFSSSAFFVLSASFTTVFLFGIKLLDRLSHILI